MKQLHKYLLTKNWYSKWHGNKHSNAVHYAILAFVFLSASSTTVSGILEIVRVNSANTPVTVQQKPATPKPAPPIVQQPIDTPFVIVKFARGLGSQKRSEVATKERLALKKNISQIDVQVFKVDDNDTAQEVVDRLKLRGKGQVEYAEVDMLVAPSYIPNDPSFPSQWHLNKIGAPTAWDATRGQNVIIAILDTGVDCTHPDLLGNCLLGWNFYDNSSSTIDTYGHGSEVAGSAAASINNLLGVAGVSGTSKIIPIRISDDTGLGSWSAMAQGLVYAADRGARVANISYMVGGILTVQNAAQYMKNKGVLVFVSAGNTGAEYAASSSLSLIPVSATDSNDTRAGWSSYGQYVDLSAPGVGIYTTAKGGGYAAPSGTSFSSPITAGVAALIFAINPQLTSSQAESILFSTTDDLGTTGWDMYYGYGRVNAAKAVALASSTIGTLAAPDTQAPTSPVNVATSGLTSSQVNLTWNPSVDNVLVSQYVIYRNGVKFTTTTGTTYTDTTLAPSTAYTYTISARDAAGNESAQSASVSVTTPATPLTVSSYSVTGKTATTATVSFTTSKATSAYIKYGKTATSLTTQVPSATISGTSHSVSLSGLTGRTTYYYQVVATDGTAQALSPVTSFKTTNR